VARTHGAAPKEWGIPHAAGLVLSEKYLTYSVPPNGPNYRALHKLASGGIADVYLAEGVVPGRGNMRVALKRLRSHLSHDARMRALFADEIRLGRLCSHPNLVATLDAGELDGQPFAVLELVEGTSLLRARHALRSKGERFTRAQAVRIAMELCKGLAHLHSLKDAAGRELGVVHRDVTPPNVLLGSDGRVKLCDLGFAKWAEQTERTDAGVIKGKFSYLSPEAALEQPIDHRADCYAVGIMLWEMLTMDRLFDAPTDYDTFKLAQRAEIPKLASRGGDADEVLEQIVIKCLAREPADRYRSANALHDALAAYADWQELTCDLAALVRRCRPAPPVEAFVQLLDA
jgi:serine/threonine protein kinase